MTWYLDTNACVGFLRGTSTDLRARLLSHAPSQIRIPVIVEAELLVGARKSARSAENLQAVRAFLRPFAVAAFDSACAEYYADVRAGLEAAGTVIGPHDLLIAATVLAGNGVLVTHNTSEFARVPDLRWEDWP